MESRVWQQSPVLTDILENGHRYHVHQLLHLLEQLLPEQEGQSGLERVQIRPDTSLAFPASDVRGVYQLNGNAFEVVVRFLGLYGVDSPLPQYILDDVTEGGESGKRLQAFLDVFNQRLYHLLHQVWKKQNLFSCLDQTGLYYRLVSGMTGQYWQREDDVMAFGGSFLGHARDSETLEDILRQLMSTDQVRIESDVVSWVPVEDCMRLNATQALGLETCLGDSIPMMGKKVRVKVGPIDQELSNKLQPKGVIGQQMSAILNTYLPNGVDYEVVIELNPEFNHDWVLGSEQSTLAVHTQLGNNTGRGINFKFSSDQYL